MSIEALNWAFKQPVPQSSAKFVLIALANRANPDNAGRVVAYPSVDYLAQVTAQNRKTIISNIGKLKTWGLIEDSGERVGRTGQVIVYVLNCPPDLFAEQSQKRNCSKSGTVPKTDGNSPVFSSEQSQKRDTDSSITPLGFGKALTLVASRFADWWAAYPKHVKRKDAEAIWQRRGLDAIADKLIADALNRTANDDGWQRGYVPDPTTYLNQERWNDDLRTAPVARPATSEPSKTFGAMLKIRGMGNAMADNGTATRVNEVALLGSGSDPGE